MRRAIVVGGIALLFIVYFGLGLFYSSLAVPGHGLEVSDPAIQEWLSDDDVVISPQGLATHLENKEMYIQPGQRVDGRCRYHTSLYTPPDEGAARVVWTLATNDRICERLVEEGTRRR